MKFRSLIFVLLFFTLITKAQTSPQLNSSEILQGIKKLNVTGSVLYIAAHPDDENTRLLAYLSKEKGYKTGYLALTRGDGGQNLIGNEQSEDLGLIRTQELLAARRNDGALQFFTRANDFGFSKTPEETFKIWNKDSILSDVVYIIRKFRPDVIITRFPPDERAGHGHHAASSILAQEAFDAAANPNKFPEQLKEVSVWQAKRILWNNYNFGGNDNTSNDQLKIDVGVYNPLLGKSYGEIAAESRSMHKSQGFGSSKQRGSAIEYFSVWKGVLPKGDLMEGIKTDWTRFDKTTDIQHLISNLKSDFQADQPEKSIPVLLSLYRSFDLSNADPIYQTKTKEVKDLILACSGTWFEAYAEKPAVAINTSYKVRVDAISQLKDVSITIKRLGKSTVLAANQLQTIDGSITSEEISQPYWLKNAHEVGMYKIGDQNNLNYPEGMPAQSIDFLVNINDVNLSFTRPIVYKYTDQVRGEVYQPLAITPPVTINLDSKAFIFNGAETKNITLKLKTFKDDSKGTLSLALPKGWTASPSTFNFDLKKYGEEITVAFKISAQANATNGDLKASLIIDGKTYSKGIKIIAYEHIPTITYFPSAEAKLVKLDLKTTAKNIGYIMGAGDLVPDMLKEIGLNVTMLSENEIMNGDLSKYDAIIAGVRTYNVNDRIAFEQPKLLKYVESGGVYLVQYNVNRPLMMDQIGPYPFVISRDRVTEEDATVNFIKPESKALNYPNKITAKDFENWIQERGIYFAQSVDPHYEKPLSMKDTGEKESDGSLLIANYGKGKYVYTGLDFFRELPAGVPGAYRLLMNLISK
ncbi:MAG: PIG-L family deacetylase [Bacteroidetes bacterium]|nr:PIG-L family deacetylase [Bacteroidota bacterium]MBU1373475.1 PIG-L family deacetylase [Bacteroidota bacterium]MBU1485233.1 PIG-L family deacetylase [Bacteroidota bacterium]MBU1760763.1 PIG-L family deacetylase [Bacteroidota bacterium]MBU2266987.1 PIG-L family deacetylase [Bacteroidota bacterium]